MPASPPVKRCNNCGQELTIRSALVLKHEGEVIARICATCLDAKKVTLTLQKEKSGNWIYYQYLPLEA